MVINNYELSTPGEQPDKSLKHPELKEAHFKAAFFSVA